jgi:hypothetical protein
MASIGSTSTMLSIVENLRELGGGLGRLTRRKVRHAPDVDGIEGAEESVEADAADGKVEAGSGLQGLNRGCRIGGIEREMRSQSRQVNGRHRRVLGKALLEIVGKRSGSRHVARHGQRERGAITDVAAPGERKCPGCPLSGGSRIPVKRFPHRGCHFEHGGPFSLPGPLCDVDGNPRTSASLPAIGRSERVRAPPGGTSSLPWSAFPWRAPPRAAWLRESPFKKPMKYRMRKKLGDSSLRSVDCRTVASTSWRRFR